MLPVGFFTRLLIFQGTAGVDNTKSSIEICMALCMRYFF
jgi:hypothetical protein